MAAVRALLILVLTGSVALLAGCAREGANAAQAPGATPDVEPPGAPAATAPSPAHPATPVRPEPLVTLEFQDMAAASAVEVLAAVSGRTIAIAPECAGSVTLNVHDRPWREVLDSVAGQCGARVVELPGGRWRVEPVR